MNSIFKCSTQYIGCTNLRSFENYLASFHNDSYYNVKLYDHFKLLESYADLIRIEDQVLLISSQMISLYFSDPTCAASSTEKLQYKKQDPSSLTPYLPERLTSSGWSGLSSVWTCALNSLMEFPNPEGFLYNSVTGLCSPLISMVSPSSPGALAVQPTEGDLYLFNHEGRTAKFQVLFIS